MLYPHWHLFISSHLPQPSHHRALAHAALAAQNTLITYFEKVIPTYPLECSSHVPSSGSCPWLPWPDPKLHAPLLQYPCCSHRGNLITLCGIAWFISISPSSHKALFNRDIQFWWEFHLPDLSIPYHVVSGQETFSGGRKEGEKGGREGEDEDKHLSGTSKVFSAWCYLWDQCMEGSVSNSGS